MLVYTLIYKEYGKFKMSLYSREDREKKGIQ